MDHAGYILKKIIFSMEVARNKYAVKYSFTNSVDYLTRYLSFRPSWVIVNGCVG